MSKHIRLLEQWPVPVDSNAEVGVVIAELCAPTPPPYAAVLWQGDGDEGIAVEEHALRGADWLAENRDRGAYRHLALARRAPGLTRAEFRRRWREHGGTVGTSAGTVSVPAAAQGAAYVQNHPTGDDPAYDAINEVFFTDLDALRQRVEWFAANPPLPGELFGPTTFLAVEMQRPPNRR